MKNEIKEGKVATKNYKRRIQRSITIEKIFSQPNNQNHQLLLGEKISKQKKKFYKDLNLDKNDEIIQSKKEEINGKNFIKSQNKKIKNLINQLIVEVYSEDENEENNIIQEKKRKSRRHSVSNLVTQNIVSSLKGDSSKKIIEINLNEHLGKEFSLEAEEKTYSKKINLFQKKSNPKNDCPKDKKATDKKKHSSVKFLISAKEFNSKDLESRHKKNDVISNNVFNNIDKKDDNDRLRDCPDDTFLSLNSHSNLSKEKDKLIKQPSFSGLTELNNNSDSEINQSERIESCNTRLMHMHFPVDMSKKSNCSSKTELIQRNSKPSLDIIDSITRNQIVSDERKINVRDESDNFKTNTNIDQNGDLFNVAMKNIIKKKFTIKDHHITNRSESPLIETTKLNHETSSKIISTNLNSVRNAKLESNHNNPIFINEKQRKIRKLNLVCDSQSEDEEEFEMTSIANSCFLIYPDSSFKKYWDWLIFIVTFYFMIMSPFYIAYGGILPRYMCILEFSLECIYFIDVIINFFLPFKDFNENLVLNQNYLIVNYLTSWFIIDLLSAFPSNTIYNISGTVYFNTFYKYVLIYSSLRLIKLLKILKLIYSQDERKENEFRIKIMEKFNLTPAEIRILKFTITLFISVHILSCLWIFIASVGTPNWMSYANLSLDQPFDTYVASVYFILTTIFTIGYGDILSISLTERVYNILIMGIGVLIYSFAVGSVSTLIFNYDIITKHYHKNLEILEDISRIYPNLDGALYLKLHKFIIYDYKFNKTDKFTFIGDLPNKIKNELLYDMYKNMISNFTFFKYGFKFKSEDFNSKIVLKMRPVKLVKGDVIFRENDRVNELIFVKQGIISAQLTFDEKITKMFELRRNDHFGDVFVLSNQRCPVDLVVKSKNSELFIIKKDELLSIAKEFPEIFNEIINVSTKNYKRMKLLIDSRKKKFNIETGKVQDIRQNIDSAINTQKQKHNSIYDDEDEDEENRDKHEIPEVQDRQKDIISNFNLDVIKESDEIDDEEMNDNEEQDFQEEGEVSPIKKSSVRIEKNDFINETFLENTAIPPDDIHKRKFSSEETIINNSNNSNTFLNNNYPPYDNNSSSQFKDTVKGEELFKVANSKEKIITISNRFSFCNTKSFQEPNNYGLSLVNKFLKNDVKESIPSNGKDKEMENGIQKQVSMKMVEGFTEKYDFKCNAINPFFKRNFSRNLEKIEKDNLNGNTILYSPNKLHNSSNDIFCNINQVIKDIKTLKPEDSSLLLKPPDINSNSLIFNDDKKITRTYEEALTKETIESKKIEKDETLKSVKTIILNKQVSGIEKVLSKDGYKKDLSLSIRDMNLNNKFNNTLIPSVDTSIDSNKKKHSLMIYSQNRKNTEFQIKPVSIMGALKQGKTLRQNIKTNIEAAVNIDKDPTNFMIREISRVEKKLIGYKRKEMKELISKLDEIYDLISKK